MRRRLASFFPVYHPGSGTASDVTSTFSVGGCLSTGNITTLNLFQAGTYSNGGSGTIGTVIGLSISNLGAYNSPTAMYGINIAANTGAVGTSKYGLYIGEQSGASNNFAIYSVGGRYHFDKGNTVFNENGGDYDFRIEGDTDTDLFFCDAGNNRVGIGTSSPGVKLEVSGDVKVTGGYMELSEISKPSNPSSNLGRLYAKDDSGTTGLYFLDSAGTETDLLGDRSGVPTGAIMWFAASTAPSGWLECDGSEISMTTYEDLYDATGNVFGLDGGTSCTADNATDTFTAASHGLSDDDAIEFTATTMPTGLSADTKYYVINSTTNTFRVSTTKGGSAVNFTTNGSAVKFHEDIKLPDLRGEFVRGWDHGRGVDGGRTYGSAQEDEFASHSHSFNAHYTTEYETTSIVRYSRYGGYSGNTNSSGGGETRPRNIALLPCIKC